MIEPSQSPTGLLLTMNALVAQQLSRHLVFVHYEVPNELSKASGLCFGHVVIAFGMGALVASWFK